jgi:carboxyl-terminal processing protease
MHWLPEFTETDLFLLDVSLKAGFVLAVAWATAQVLQGCRGSPASRHAVWTLAIGGVLALPLLAAALPPWSIAMPWQHFESTVHQPLAGSHRAQGPVALRVTDTAAVPTTVPVAGSPPTIASAGEPSHVESASSKRGRLITTGARWLFPIWLIGACLALGPAVLGVISLWRLGWSARRVEDGPLADALRRSMARLGMKRPIRLLESDRRYMPMTWGSWRPTILLPKQARCWSSDRLEIVMLHELAHIQRRDCMIQSLAHIARALYWFNPLSWLAEHQLRALNEQACDDRVLTAGCEAPDYAEHLLAVSADCRTPTCATGLAMARASKLERRLVSILNPDRNRRPITRRRLATAALVGMALLPPLSVVHLDSAVGGETPPRSPTQDAQPAGPPSDLSTALAALRAKIADQYVTPVNDKEIVQYAIRGMISALHDPYSDYLTPEMLADMEKQIGGTLVGIGVQLETRDRQIRVVTPLEDSPALNAGIRPGDVILQIDGAPTDGLELNEAVKLIAGPPGTAVRLTLGREGREEAEVTIPRGSIRIPSIKGFQRGADHHWSFLLDAVGQIGYVQVVHFGNATADELREAVDSLRTRGLKGFILDLRSCPGGLLESAVAVTNLFLQQGTIVSIHGRIGELKTIAANASSALGDLPLVVLVNGQTASAGEIVAGALKDNQRALVVGTRTFGKGSVQTLIKLEEANGAIKLTTAHYRLPSGRSIDRSGAEKSWGVDPDEGFFVPVDPDQLKGLLALRQEREIIGKGSGDRPDHPQAVTPQWIEREQRDPQLAAALKTMITRLASGRFLPVSDLSPSEIEVFLKREDVQRRRSTLEKDLERVTRELADLEKQSPAKK